MSQGRSFRINLPTLFEQVNARRKEQGLASVEPAVMAVRASIKFAINRQRYMDLQSTEIDLEKTDADALCHALGELFNVDLHLDGDAREDKAAASAPTATGAEDAPRILPMFQFYAAINRQRRAKGLQPVEPAVISVHTGIKFSIMRRRALNFREDKLILSDGDLAALDEIVAQQFDVVIPGGLRSLCQAVAEAAPASAAPGAEAGTDGKRFLGRLLHGIKTKGEPGMHTRHYALDINNLLLSIITRRAYLGHRPITPDKVKKRCREALSAELELEVDLNDERITLTPEQLDRFANLIRKEFEIMFEDMGDLLGRKTKT
ncbi:MAG: hypothetical protein M0037_06715 [Betaproteobacteria bacterium]|nr:hypothetical protein [Betaproteobacteria bacterium]